MTEGSNSGRERRPIQPWARQLIERYVKATAHMSTREAGEHIGVSHTTIVRWRNENYRGEPDSETKKAILDYFGEFPPRGDVDLSDLFAD